MASKVPEFTTTAIANVGVPASQDTIKAATDKTNEAIKQIANLTEQFNLLVPESIKVFNKVEDLRGFIPTVDGSQIQAQTKGYYTNGDGGGNTFYWDSTSELVDNGYNVVKPNSYIQGVDSGRWLRIGKTGILLSGRDLGGISQLSTTPEIDREDFAVILNKFFNKTIAGITTGSRSLDITGDYFLTPDAAIFTNFNSCVLRATGIGFSSELRAINNTEGAFFTIGYYDPTLDEEGEPIGYSASQSSIIERMTFALENGINQGAIKFIGKNNILDLQNINVRQVGTGGYAITNDSADTLFQEIYLRRLEVNGFVNTGYNNDSYGVKIYPTGNIEFYQCNIEAVKTAIFARYQRQGSLVINGGHFERNLLVLDVDGCEVHFKNAEVGYGMFWLGKSCHSGDLNISRFSSDVKFKNGIIDNGFGNKIYSPAFLYRDTKGKGNNGINKSGKEWLFTRNIETDPLFYNGVTVNGWISTKTTKIITLENDVITTGEIVVTIDGSDYTTVTTNANTPTEIATLFVSNHSATILSNHGLTVTNLLGVISMIYEDGIDIPSDNFEISVVFNTSTGITATVTSSNNTVILSTIQISAPRTNGRALSLYAPSANGAVQKEYSIETTKEYCLCVGVAYSSSSYNNTKIEVRDGDNTLIFSELLDNILTKNSVGHSFTFFKKLLPANATGIAKVRIVQTEADNYATIPLVLLVPSDITQGLIAGEDSTTGLGADIVYNKAITTGNKLTISIPSNSNGRAIVRFKASKTGSDVYFTADNDTNSINSYGYFPILGDEREYTFVLPKYPSAIQFFNFSDTPSNLSISELSVHYLPYEETSGTGSFIYQTGQTVQKADSGFVEIGTTSGNNKTIITAKFPDKTGFLAIKLMLLGSGNDYFEGTIFIRKSSGVITDPDNMIIHELVDLPLSRYSIDFNKLSETAVEIQISNTRTQSFTTFFYDVYTNNVVSIEL